MLKIQHRYGEELFKFVYNSCDSGDPVHNVAGLRQLDAQPHHLHGVQPGLQGRLQEDHDLQYFEKLKINRCSALVLISPCTQMQECILPSKHPMSMEIELDCEES